MVCLSLPFLLCLQTVVDAIAQRIGQMPVYLTLDIDCLDPAFAPGTGTPEPGGLSSTQVLTLLEELAGLNFVGMDCVEVAPAYDHAELTSNAAAKDRATAEAEALRPLLAPMVAAGYSLRKMSDALAAGGTTTRTGKPLSPSGVKNHLQRLGLGG